MYDQSTPIGKFLDAAAAKQPAPGGGSVTALVGALAASMGEMTVNYSVGKKGLEAHAQQLHGALAGFHRARQLLIELMVEDQSAYESLTAARKLPEDSDERCSRFPAALLASIRTPQAIAAAAAALLELADQLVEVVNYYLLSDLAVCADLAMATARCAVHNVRVNLPDVTDPAERARLEQTAQHALSRATDSIRRVSPRIWERHARGK